MIDRKGCLLLAVLIGVIGFCLYAIINTVTEMLL